MQRPSIVLPSSARPTTKVRFEKCSTCKWAEPAEQVYFCHRNPPMVTVLTDPNGQPTPVAAWPPVRPDQWCGEHTPSLELAS